MIKIKCGDCMFNQWGYLREPDSFNSLNLLGSEHVNLILGMNNRSH